MIAAGQTAHVIVGPARSGKTTRLRELAEAARAQDATREIVVTAAPDALSVHAFGILRRAGVAAENIDDIDAAALLEAAAAELLDLEWPELLDASLDPEVGGLRSPQRFLASAYRLFRKLREAAIDPEEFRSRALAGATNFYAKPPNFAHPELIGATKETYRDSLDVTPAELERQRLREIDLAKILASLYRRYLDATIARGTLTCRDAVAYALTLLTGDHALRDAERARKTLFFIDEAQELSGAEIALLRLLCGEELSGVTLAGDAESAVSAHAASAGHRILASAPSREELHLAHGVPAAARNAIAQLRRDTRLPEPQAPPELHMERYADERAEIDGVVARVRAWIAQGVAPEQIAIIFRSVCDVAGYERALLDSDIPASTSGDVNIFNDPRALDALGLLWNVWNPFAHEWMLRTLEGPSMALSDASLAILCSEPADPQGSLFEVDDERSPTTRPSRWDPKRDLRLGWNVLRGDLDDALSPVARDRVRAWRQRRERWTALATTAPLETAIRTILNEGLARDGATGSARERAQHLLLERLIRKLLAHASTLAYATLGDVLDYAAARRESEFESCEDDVDAGVAIRSIAACRGRAYDRVLLPDVRAGSFPRWYAPDAFLFSPQLGMIPKENAGNARAARTAKFTYYVHRVKAREAFNDAERRALCYALTRSTGELAITTSGRATRGISAPEFFEELKHARLPGVSA